MNIDIAGQPQKIAQHMKLSIRASTKRGIICGRCSQVMQIGSKTRSGLGTDRPRGTEMAAVVDGRHFYSHIAERSAPVGKKGGEQSNHDQPDGSGRRRMIARRALDRLAPAPDCRQRLVQAIV